MDTARCYRRRTQIGGREVLHLVVLLILAGLWAVVLLPPLLRSRTERSGDSIGDFTNRLDVLSRTNGAVGTPERAGLPPIGSAAKRRRDVLRVLFGGVTVTLLLAFVTGATVFWGLQIIADVLLGAYLLAWAYVRSSYAERIAKLRYLPQYEYEYEYETAAPEFALRRAGSS